MKIGIDIGGSHIGVGLVEEFNIIKMYEKNFVREDRNDIEKTIIDTIIEFINKILSETNYTIDDIELIGIAAPGAIRNGHIYGAGNLGIVDFNLVEKLNEYYDIPIQMRNDAQCAGLAEKYYGSMKDYDDAVYICLGTGIGTSVFLGRKLLKPKIASGFEIGHMIINKNGRKCKCGKNGCFETYASIKALKNKVAEVLDIDNDFSGQYLREEILNKCKDEKVDYVVEQFLEDLKIGLGNIIDIFKPEIISIGGSFAYYENHPIYNRLIEKMNQENTTSYNNSKTIITLSKFKNGAGIIGATIKE